MTKSYLLLTILAALTLPCTEVPEWLTKCDDPSNDFVLMTSKPETVSFHVIQNEPLPQVRSSRRFLAPRANSTSELPSVTGQELLVFFSLQKR